MGNPEGSLEFQQVISGNIRRLRQERGLLQEDIATAARWLGFGWSSVTVTQIESKSRGVALEEFLMLPLLLRCTLKDLIEVGSRNETIEMGFRVYLDSGTLIDLVTGKAPSISDDQLAMPGLEASLDPKIKEAIRRANLEPTLLSYLLIREGARGEAERKAAQTLKVAAVTITAYALRAWGRPFTEERDARAAEQASREKELRAVRGHVTRTLLRRIEEEHAAARSRANESVVKLKPASPEERQFRNISISDYEHDETTREKARATYDRWMRFKIAIALEKEGTTR